MAQDPSQLSAVERTALTLGRLANETGAGKRAQWAFHQFVTKTWVTFIQGRRVYVDGCDWLTTLQPDRGVLVTSNHRTFFDQYIMMLAMYTVQVHWAKKIYFPVRANFFYQKPIGMLINYLVSAGTMYPPIFREIERGEHNKDAISRIVKFLQEPNTLVGVHPEGTRCKSDDPYEMLRAQPGVGQMILRGKPLVVPMWISGLSNDFVSDVKSNWQKDIRQTNPIIIVGGQPVDYSAFEKTKPRPTLYLKCANMVRGKILELAEREKEIRAQCASGEIGPDDPNWLTNRVAG